MWFIRGYNTKKYKVNFFMDILSYVIAALGISVIINLVLKRLGISQIIGYIVTGTIIVYLFDLRHMTDSHTLELVGEFGIVFLMFTIGLEISLQKLNTMKMDVFGNGLMQVGITALLFYGVSHYVFNISNVASVIIALAFALSSTAVVLTFLKQSKEINLPYGQRSMGILIFQDIAVIPILLLIGFLSVEDASVSEILFKTAWSAVLLIGLLFTVGKRVMTWLLHFSANSMEEELFMGSVLVIVFSASLAAHMAGFTYSLGAFVAGMIIAETKYHHKVETDIASFKDLLLGTFFVTVGMKIDLIYFSEHILSIVGVLLLVLVAKMVLIFGIMRFSSTPRTSFKTALALSQVGEFSFAVFALASSSDLIDAELVQFLVLVVVLSMIITPFLITKIGVITDKLFKASETLSKVTVEDKMRKNHVVVCGYSVVGHFVVDKLHARGSSCVIVDYNIKHVREGLAKGEEIYWADISKPAILESLHVADASAVVVTLDNIEKKRAICEAILAHAPKVNLVVKVSSLDGIKALQDLPISVIVDSKREVAKILVEKTLSCSL